MALQPLLQSIAEHRMVRSTVGVITNCREDHLDVMGPEPVNVAEALCGTVPRGKPIVTAEQRFIDVVESAAKTMEAPLCAISEKDLANITDEEMTAFGYYEHRDNVAVALRVAELCGVSREEAMKGMHQVEPDDGALRVFQVPFFGRDITFVHGFAANDHESSEQIWNLSSKCFSEYKQRMVVLNVRADRPDRSKRLGQSIPTWRPHVDHVILTGTGIPIAARELMQAGFPPGSVTFAEDHTAREVFEEILNPVAQKALVVGIGNVADPGLALVTLFRNRGTPVPMSRFYPGSKAND
jgi:poly-gamma-glutamate synthase PgsB/CapB